MAPPLRDIRPLTCTGFLSFVGMRTVRLQATVGRCVLSGSQAGQMCICGVSAPTA